MSAKTTFLLPDFDKNIPNKINENVEVKSRHVLFIKQGSNWHSCIATSGFSSKIDGVYVFAMKIDNIGLGDLLVGFTDVKTYDSKKGGYLGYDLTGTSLYSYYGNRCPGHIENFSRNVTQMVKEIISILTISKNGGKKEIQWIVDENEGPVQDCTKDFGDGDEVFPCISLHNDGQQVELIPFDQVTCRSPKIDELMKEYKKPNIQMTSSAPSTSTAANDALISQLRDQVGRSQDLLIQQSEKRIQQLEQHMQQQLTAKDHLLQQQISGKDQQLQQQLAAKDQLLQQQNAIWQQQLSAKDQQVATVNQQHERVQRETRESFLGQLDVKDKQLELERAEHQKTRNLLHQIKMELKDMEIYYFTKENEFGQRRQREEENEQFKVKQERGSEEEEKEPKKRTTNKKK